MNERPGNENDFVKTKVNEDYTRLFLHKKKTDLHPCQTSKMEKTVFVFDRIHISEMLILS